MFYVILDIQLSEVTDEQFLVSGNGEDSGTFSYDELPLQLVPLDANSETNWEFVVIDATNSNCAGSDQTGLVSCDPSGIYTLYNVIRLKVRYDAGRPHFIPPENELDFTLWCTNDVLLAQWTGDFSIST